MEKTITIDGKDVRFKSTGATVLRYKAQFGRDFFADIMKLQVLSKLGKQPTAEQLQSIEIEVLYNLCWVLAKTADKSIPEPMEWLDTFDEFPIIEIIPQLQDLLISTFQSKKK